MRALRLLLCLCSCLAVSACATVIEGTTDTITVSTTPPGARCDVTREGAPLGTIAQTPGSLSISKSMNGILVTCAKPGHDLAEKTHMPNSRATTFGNAIAGGVIGVVVDMASGANFKYPPIVELLLLPQQPPAQMAESGAAPTARPGETRPKSP